MSESGTRTEPPNRELVVYALHLLNGAVERVHTEDIAIKAHELFPGSFSWTRHPDLPDKDIVRVALTDARKERYGSLVEGRTGQHKGQYTKTKRDPALDGWILTEAGLNWIKENQAHFEAAIDSTGEIKTHRQKVLRQLERFRNHRFFGDFTREPDSFSPGIGGLADLLRCRVDADEEVWVQRLEAIRRKARVAEQSDVLDFVDACESAYRVQK